MKIPTYLNGRPTGEEKELPDDLIQKAHVLAMFMLDTGALSIYGIGPVADIQCQLAEITRERDEWKLAYAAQQKVVQDIGRNLGAKVPYELVNEVARKRMAELAEVTRERDTLKAMVDLHDALNDRRRAQANETTFKRRMYENG